MTILSLNPTRKPLTKQTYKLTTYTCNTTRSSTSTAPLLSKCSNPSTRKPTVTPGSSILLPGASPPRACRSTSSLPGTPEFSVRPATASSPDLPLSVRPYQLPIISRCINLTSGHRESLRRIKWRMTASPRSGSQSNIRYPPLIQASRATSPYSPRRGLPRISPSQSNAEAPSRPFCRLAI